MMEVNIKQEQSLFSEELLNHREYLIKRKGHKMPKKDLITVLILGLLFTLTPFINAQESPTEKKESKMMMQGDDMQKCMEKISADSTMRMQMMNMMMTTCKDDKKGMMQMCKTMMDNPEMHKMMMKKMQGEGMMDGGMMKHKMMCDSTKTIEKSDHDSQHHKK